MLSNKNSNIRRSILHYIFYQLFFFGLLLGSPAVVDKTLFALFHGLVREHLCRVYAGILRFGRFFRTNNCDISGIGYGFMQAESGAGTIPVIYIDGISGATTVQTVVLSYQENALSVVYTDSPDRFPNTARSIFMGVCWALNTIQCSL